VLAGAVAAQAGPLHGGGLQAHVPRLGIRYVRTKRDRMGHDRPAQARGEDDPAFAEVVQGGQLSGELLGPVASYRSEQCPHPAP